jgi:hypothetical protein
VSDQSRQRWPGWAGPLWLVLGLAVVVILWLAPSERTLGEGIRWVYIHVAVIWTAMLGMLVVGGLNLIQVFSGRDGWRLWSAAASWGTLGLLVLAVMTSTLVMQVNWGGISWDEPRIGSLLRAVAIWVILHFAGPWIGDRRLRGVLTAAAVAAAVIPLRFAPLVIHPQDPLGQAASNDFLLASLALFAVVLAASVSVVWLTKQRLKP